MHDDERPGDRGDAGGVCSGERSELPGQSGEEQQVGGDGQAEAAIEAAVAERLAGYLELHALHRVAYFDPRRRRRLEPEKPERVSEGEENENHGGDAIEQRCVHASDLTRSSSFADSSLESRYGE